MDPIQYLVKLQLSTSSVLYTYYTYYCTVRMYQSTVTYCNQVSLWMELFIGRVDCISDLIERIIILIMISILQVYSVNTTSTNTWDEERRVIRMCRYLQRTLSHFLYQYLHHWPHAQRAQRERQDRAVVHAAETVTAII